MHGNTLAGWLQRARLSRPTCRALSGGGEVWSYADLARQARHLSCWLVGVIPGQGVLGLLLRSRWNAAWLTYAATLAGVPLMPIDPRLPAAIRERLFREAGVKRVLTDHPLPAPPAGIILIDWPEDLAMAAAKRLPRHRSGPRSGDVHLILATGGSSGCPRGVMLTGANLAAHVRASHARMPLGPGNCWLLCLPLYHIGGLAVLYRCLAAGAEVLLHPNFDAARVWADLHGHAVSHISLVPAMLARLLDTAADRSPPTSLEYCLVGGAALSPALASRARRHGWPLCVTYGLSEATSQVATACAELGGGEPGWTGRPLPGMEVRVSAPDRQGIGRLWLRGPMVMAGYANPGLEAGTGVDEGWLETGDLGRLDRDGNLILAGRADDLLIGGGENVHPAWVEAILSACPGVEAVAVSARADPVWGDRLVACVVGSASEETVRAFARTRLSGPWLPREYHRLDPLPLTGIGKLDRKALRRQVRGLPDRSIPPEAGERRDERGG